MRNPHILLQLVGLTILLCLPACESNDNERFAEKVQSAKCLESSVIIEPHHLQNMLTQADNICLIEVSKAEQFRLGHVPGAQNIWRPDYAEKEAYPFGGMRADSLQVANLLKRKGMDMGDQLILYDRRGDVDAIRFMWILKTLGYHKAQILNGGISHWESQGLPLEEGRGPKPDKGNFHFSFPSSYVEPVMEISDVQHALKDSSWILLDTRSVDEYEGELLKKGAFRKGRIPGSIHLDWIDMIYADVDHRFKSCEEIEPMLLKRGIFPHYNIITYCHSGVRSAHMAFVLREIMGYPRVWNYDGSWTEWSYHEELPIAI